MCAGNFSLRSLDGLAFDCGDLVHKQEDMKMRRVSSRGGPAKSLRGQQK